MIGSKAAAARRGRAAAGFQPDFEIAGVKESELRQQSSGPANNRNRGGASAVASGSNPAKEPDVSSAIQSALRNGVLHIANRRVTKLPWEQMFPDERPDDEAENNRIATKITSFSPAAAAAGVGATPLRTGRKIISHSNKGIGGGGGGGGGGGTVVDLSGGTSSQQQQQPIKFWEGHPLISVDCSCNDIEQLHLDFPRWARLGETLKILLAGTNSVARFPSFAPFSQLITLNVARNSLSGDLCQILMRGTQQQQQQPQEQEQQHQPGKVLLPSLAELVASHNAGITGAWGLLQLIAPNLRVLRLDHCNIQQFSLLLLPVPTTTPIQQQQQQQPFVSSLREVDLSHNQLISCSAFFSTPIGGTESVCHPCLEILDLSHNNFANLDIRFGLLPLEQQQQQSHLWRQHLATLRSLSLRKGGIISATLSSLPMLQELNLSENQLQQFPEIDLASRARLASIDVSSNKIVSLAPLTHRDQPGSFTALERLALENNEIKDVPPRLCLAAPALRAVSLQGNPLRSVRRELLQARNASELMAYLRTRLDERENDDVTSSTAMKLQMAMDSKNEEQRQRQQQQPPQSSMMSSSSSLLLSDNNVNCDPQISQQRHQQSQFSVAASSSSNNLETTNQRNRGGGGGGGGNNNSGNGVILMGVMNGKQWDMSRLPEQRGIAAIASRRADVAASSASPLLPEILQASTISDVAPHEHIKPATSLRLDGQQRLKKITTDFFKLITPNLEELDISRSSVCCLDFLGAPDGPCALKSLKAAHCDISGHYPVHWCRPSPGPEQKLVSLDLSHNRVTELPIEFGLAVSWSLKSLSLSNNRLGHVPEAVLHLRFLTDLSLASNGIPSLPEMPALFECWPAMTMLDLSGNNLSLCPPQGLARALGGFAPETMRSLRLETNGIRWLQRLVDGQSAPLLAALKDRMSQ